MIDYDVPFYANTEDRTHCFQAAIRIILKYFRPDEEYSWDELDRAAAKVEGKWTWPMAGLLWLKNKGFEVRDIEVFDYEAFANKGGQYLIETFGESVANEQIQNSNIQQELEFAKQFAREIQIEMRLPTHADMCRLLDEGYLVMCNINSRALNNSEGYVGHFVVVKGYEGKVLILHDPGPPPLENRKVAFADFEKAWAYPDEKAKNIMAFRLNG